MLYQIVYIVYNLHNLTDGGFVVKIIYMYIYKYEKLNKIKTYIISNVFE